MSALHQIPDTDNGRNSLVLGANAWETKVTTTNQKDTLSLGPAKSRDPVAGPLASLQH